MLIAQAAPRNSRVRISAESAWPLRAPCGLTYAERAARGIEVPKGARREAARPKARARSEGRALTTPLHEPSLWERLTAKVMK